MVLACIPSSSTSGGSNRSQEGWPTLPQDVPGTMLRAARRGSALSDRLLVGEELEGRSAATTNPAVPTPLPTAISGRHREDGYLGASQPRW
jgi:hypothetical protein